VIARPPRLAGAPITWGVCEVPGWGCQLGPERVLAEIASLGLGAVELGPRGFLPEEPSEVARTLARHDLRLAAGFVPALLHRPEHRASALAGVDAAAATLARSGAEVLVLAAELGQDGYDSSAELAPEEWQHLLDALHGAEEIAARRGLVAALHPHFGTAVEGPAHVARVLEGSRIPLCLDTGHLVVGGADPVEVVRAARGRIAHVHLKDVDAGLASQVRNGTLGYRDAVAAGLYRPLGDGTVDLAAVLRLLRESEFAGWYVLEQDVVLDREPAPGAGPIAEARRSVDFIRRILA
jgi:inosose dehydratase